VGGHDNDRGNTMNDHSGDGPSRKSLARAAAWTFAGAAAITVLFVLPAEYGIDPTGLGTRLGLTRLADADDAAPGSPPRLVEGEFPSPPAEFDFFDPEVLGDPFSRTQDRRFRSEKIEIPLDELEQVEVKAVMRQGDAFVYAWRLLEGSAVYTDFHADPLEIEKYPEQYWIRYHESESNAESGSIVAPFNGNHGWYWLNIEENPVRIELEVHGYFESLEEIMRSYQ